MNKIKRNAAHCLACNTIIESYYTYDWIACDCGNVFVDGGKSYLRKGVKDISMYIDLSEFEEDK